MVLWCWSKCWRNASCFDQLYAFFRRKNSPVDHPRTRPQKVSRYNKFFHPWLGFWIIITHLISWWLELGYSNLKSSATFDMVACWVFSGKLQSCRLTAGSSKMRLKWSNTKPMCRYLFYGLENTSHHIIHRIFIFHIIAYHVQHMTSYGIICYNYTCIIYLYIYILPYVTSNVILHRLQHASCPIISSKEV